MNLFDLTGKTALVTGGRNGLLGPVWVETLNDAGAAVTAFDLPEVDMGDCKSIMAAVENYRKNNSDAPDIIVNNAAIDNPPGSESSFFGNFDKIMKVNLSGAVKLVQCFLPGMIKNGGGVIVNIGSIQGYGGADYRNYIGDFEKPFGYNASKWALRGFSKSLAVQYGRYGIRAVTISFSAYNGGKLSRDFLLKFLRNVPLGRTISKESLQTSLLYAICCPELTGQDWRIDGGLGSWA
jgi:NAD(P)-dependent dehydrogenase (short-subunit alcohol dehydrogenase family)